MLQTAPNDIIKYVQVVQLGLKFNYDRVCTRDFNCAAHVCYYVEPYPKGFCTCYLRLIKWTGVRKCSFPFSFTADSFYL